MKFKIFLGAMPPDPQIVCIFKTFANQNPYLMAYSTTLALKGNSYGMYKLMELCINLV